MKNIIFTVLFVCFLVPASWACAGEEHDLYTEDLVIKSQDSGAEHNFNVEMATTPEALMQGLMYRSSMAEDHGMLFLFAKELERNFWMKNTYIPLDIIFIKESGVIHHIHENAVPRDETPLPSKGPVLNVLELNGGVTAKLGIKPGDVISLTGKSTSPEE